MANHKSAEKKARQTPRKTVRNDNIKSAVKTFEKNVLHAIQNQAANAQEHFVNYTSKIMSAVSKGVIKKQTASRKLSRLSARLAKIAQK